MPCMFKPQLVLVLIAGVIFFTNLGGPKLWDEDEPRNAACAREMLERGDWVVPTFNYELRPQKPVLLYWLMMASYSVFGVNELAARLPSALMAMGTTLVTFHLGRLLFSVRVGLFGGLMMASCLMFGVAGRAATPDSCLIFFAGLSLLAFVRQGSGFRVQVSGNVEFVGSEQQGRRVNDFLPRTWQGVLWVYVPMALAVLAKGPVGVVLPIAAIGLFLLLVDRGAGDQAGSWLAVVKRTAVRFICTAWSMRPLILLAIVVTIAGPWYVLVGLRTDGEWIRSFFGTENLSRFRGAMEGHSGPVVYYVGAILVGFFPWSIVLPASVWFAVRDALRSPRNPSYLLLVCWAGIWIGVFSLAGTKLPSYVLPAYPALALMSGAFVDRWLKQPACVPRWLMQTAWGSLAVVGIGILIALPLAARQFLPGEELISLVGLIPLIGGLVAIGLQTRGTPDRIMAAVSATAVLFSVALFAGAAMRASRHQNSAAVVEIARGENGRVPLATFAHPESSVVYYAADKVRRFSNAADVERFFEQSTSGYLITNSDGWDELQTHLPPDVAIVARQPRFLKRGEVLLVGRGGRENRTATGPAPPRL
jgi:4-amino-4-deoxy-L-arabinose transferase-like glycosyltransferase